MVNTIDFQLALDDEDTLLEVTESFVQDGFCAFDKVVDEQTVSILNERLEAILRGKYDRGQPPDKHPKPLTKKHDKCGPIGFNGNRQNIRVIQVINVHKCDEEFRSLATNPRLGELVAKLAGWKDGARLAQDQIWAKKPGAPPLVFHRDSPYFMFTPSDVVTVWVALDDMDEELGPLEYVKGSHSWGEGRVGSSNTFFQEDGGKDLVYSAADREGVSRDDLQFVSMCGLQAGGISIHNGRTFHGSAGNCSKNRPRRGLGIHFVPAEVKFTEDARKSILWKNYINEDDPEATELSEEDFPVTYKS